MHLEFLEQRREAEYNDFLLGTKSTLFYASNKYRKFLKELLQAEDFYFLAINDNAQIAGVLPSFLKRNERFGHILNSLPFYGSNGGIIEHEGGYQVKKMLLNAFNDFAESNNCIAATIITSPFETDVAFYEKEKQFAHRDERIGQLTTLPPRKGAIADDLMQKFDGVRRRNIRKALKSGVTITDKKSPQTLQFLADTHTKNIRAIHGIPKPRLFFELIPQSFEYGKDYKIFGAFKDGRIIAALLLFYFNKTVEYFTPAVVERFRTFQPLSLIIFEAMQDAVQNGYEWWNWGGTWKSQKSLYDFKKRWGTDDFPYYYYIQTYRDISVIKKFESNQVLEEYPYFYLISFSELDGTP